MKSLCVKNKKPKTFVLRLFSTNGQSLRFSALIGGRDVRKQFELVLLVDMTLEFKNSAGEF